MAFDQRPLQFKIRVAARKGMIKSQEDLIAIVESIIKTRVVPDGVVIHWMDWKKGKGGSANEGRITRDIADALEDFWFAITHEDSKVELAKLAPPGGEGRPTPRRKRSRPEG